MSTDPNVVRLVIAGREFSGWKAVRVQAGIERQARSFSLEVTDRWPANTTIRQRVSAGDLCELYIGADLVVTGYVDSTPIRYDGRSYTVSVSGRSRTADLVDCAPVGGPGQWRGSKLEAIAAALAAPYGVEVVTLTDTGAPITDHQVQQGETVFESIDRLMRLRHVLSTDDERGRLVLISVGSSRATSAIVLGENVLACDADLDFSEVYSEYVCKGQRSNDDDEDAEIPAESSASVVDPSIRRRRVMVIKQSGQADEGTCRDRVEYERAYRQARALRARYTVQGWRQASGELWAANMLVQVRDALVGLDRSMVIAEITYTMDDSGQRVDLVVGPPEGYVTKAAKAAKKSRASEAGGSWADVIPPGGR